MIFWTRGEIPSLGADYIDARVHEGKVSVSLALLDQSNQNRRMKFADSCRLHLKEEGNVVKFTIQRGMDFSEHRNIDSL